MFEKIKRFFFPKEKEFIYNLLVQDQPERKVVVVKKATTKKPAAKKKAPAKKSPAKKTVKQSTPKKK